MAHYTFKLLDIYFEEIWTGRKTLDVIQNDKNYQPGDIVEILESYPNGLFPFGRKLSIQILYIFHAGQWLTTGGCIFVFKVISKDE